MRGVGVAKVDWLGRGERMDDDCGIVWIGVGGWAVTGNYLGYDEEILLSVAR